MNGVLEIRKSPGVEADPTDSPSSVLQQCSGQLIVEEQASMSVEPPLSPHVHRHEGRIVSSRKRIFARGNKQTSAELAQQWEPWVLGV